MAKGKLLVEGAHQFSSGGEDTGHETWQISQLGHGGIIIASRAEFTAPTARAWNFTYELDRAWSPVSLTIRVEQAGRVLTTTQRASDNRWVAQVENAGQVDNYEFPFSKKHEVDFGSTLFKTVTLLRARLPVGSACDLDAVLVDPDSLVPTGDRQRYECLAEEKAQVPAGDFPALKYRRTHPDGQDAPVNDLWADHHGFVLVYQSQGDEVKLARYRRYERR